MFPILLLSAQAAAVPAVPSEEQAPAEIVVTAARTPQDAADTAASVSVIDGERIQRLGLPLLESLVRLTPSAAIAVSGPAGSFTEVRIRGAEANHSLLFIDGIRANDPAAGNIPRLELLNADIASSLEVVRGPQSALWGSEAIGGVIAVNGLPETAGHQVSAEIGTNSFRRSSGVAAIAAGAASLAAGVGWQRSAGIDSFGADGDRDGYRNLSGRVRGTWRPSESLEVGLSGFALSGRSEFDGVDLVTFVHADTLDETKNRLGAGRLWAQFGKQRSGLSGVLSTSLLGSSNVNFLGPQEINRTRGRRWTASGQIEYRFVTGRVAHTAIIAADHDQERFRSRDVLYGGASNQDRERKHEAVTAEWRLEIEPAVLDVALRHDVFSEFEDATTVRASALVDIGKGFAVTASYGEGIAQPTSFDLYGFFPGNFVGNPALRPESSRGVEASLRFRTLGLSAALTLFRQRLHDEIVDVFDPLTFQSSTVNRTLTSRRSGLEADIGWVLSEKLRLTANYAYLRATEPDFAETLQLRETRRPKHSGSLAVDGVSGPLSYGASVGYAGERIDMNFDVFPAQRVRLGSYWLAGARLGYRVYPGVELFARVSNAFDSDYREAFGYQTEGRAVFAGVRVSGGR